MAKKSKKEPDRSLIAGKPDFDRCDNKVVSARYTPMTFLPVAITEQFRRFANVYFLVMGAIMFIGQYTELYDTAISPWTTLGPLCLVISISLLVEGFSDFKRHKNDHETNNAECTILRRTDELLKEDDGERDPTILKGRDVVVNMSKTYFLPNTGDTTEKKLKDTADANERNNARVAFQRLRRKDIRQGHFVLVKNREMVPADVVLLASSNDQGGAYIETSSIDGETNLKLRTSPSLPKGVLEALRDGTAKNGSTSKAAAAAKPMESITEDKALDVKQLETLEAATRRLTRFSYLGRPDGKSVVEHKSTGDSSDAVLPAAESGMDGDVDGGDGDDEYAAEDWGGKRKKIDLRKKMKNEIAKQQEKRRTQSHTQGSDKFIGVLATEPPNASVHTFSGKLTIPPLTDTGPSYEIPLGAENVLLRGAVIRNTEWVIGLAFFTGTDTKLVQNSFDTPSKFSQLDQLINRTVLAILFVMVLCIVYLSTQAIFVNESAFDELYYAGFNVNTTELWPYFPADVITTPPDWDDTTRNWLQFFFLYVTLLNNFIPLSLYITVEMVQFFMIWLIYSDLEMYDDTTDTPALARSTIVSDLGRIEYIFSDKTGTLTQNVMRFKRCSVDGMVFGAPIQRTRPDADADDEPTSSFHPLRQLLVGRFHRSGNGLEGLGGYSSGESTDDRKLTFNSEMFLRVMSLCHTVVVEKDIDKNENISSSASNASTPGATSFSKTIFGKGKKRSDTNDAMVSPLGSVLEESQFDPSTLPMGGNRSRANTAMSLAPGDDPALMKNSDGAPMGYAYQAESPDEGALVSAASTPYGFQVIGRDSSGIRLRCEYPSHLQDESVTEGMKTKKLSLERIAATTAHQKSDGEHHGGMARGSSMDSAQDKEIREETWTILAVNKFDSDRKRMSVLLRSPPELGNLPILFCKGADSSMLDSDICGKGALLTKESSQRSMESATDIGGANADEDEWEMAHMLGMQVHLGEFAKEGLRTLVLGMRVLTEQESTDWLELYKAAATSMSSRDTLLTEAATAIEKNLHIVGATAIEDKLQKNVPETIAQLGKAGIKLWVLTGDKRETAVEIGYSTNVLTSKMHLTEVPDQGKKHVRTQMSMEFMRLIKIGRLCEYQKAALNETSGALSTRQKMASSFAVFQFKLGKCKRSLQRSIMKVVAMILGLFGMKDAAEARRESIEELESAEKNILQKIERRKIVRNVAEKTIQTWLASDEATKYRTEGTDDGEAEDTALASEETPIVFVRAQSAAGVLQDMANEGELSQPELRKLSIAHLTAHQAGTGDKAEQIPIVDEDTLSLESFIPGASGEKLDFDKKKRTLLERMFAVDREVRKGRLKKHMTEERLTAIQEERTIMPSSSRNQGDIANNRNVSRALVIEGAALKHLLGNPDYEQILFAVASNCDAVIACRVSPRQKALLVGLVRQNIDPEPITLAIGDGANDVGMIQEAHVGVGISGKEGKQAVNSSDFAIAQFRFLETLILIHGRWNFFRLSIVTLFSFYKNAVMAGTIIIYTERTKYSGTPLYDEWILSMLNFVAAWPIVFTGFFDRCLSKEYVREHPETYKATRENQLITVRSLFRWIFIVFIHAFILYFMTVPQQSYAGGVTSAFKGLMRNEDLEAPGNGEGGDLSSVGTVTFTCMIFLMAYKVAFETRSLVHGRWPAFTCREGKGEGVWSRLPYTWIGITFLSTLFYLFAISTYQLVGRRRANQFSGFLKTTNHILGMRSMSWMLILFVPIIGMIFDVVAKVFSNMFYPTQTQIHLETESKGKMLARKRGLPSSEKARARIARKQEKSQRNMTEP